MPSGRHCHRHYALDGAQILLTETEPKHQLGQIRGHAPQGYNTLLSAWRTVAHRAPTQRMYNLKGSRLKRSGDDA